MCGIAGIVGLRGIGAPERLAERMAAALAHRGPDAEGIWRDSDHLVFGHRRLSIIDLSPESNQPFHSTDGRYAAYARWGAACLDRFKGMFAFALWIVR